jgi:hypothetical protein
MNRRRMMLWMFLPLVVCMSILAVERTCAITSSSRANAPVIADKFGDEPLFQAEAKTKCAEDGAGPDTDCVNYMMQ